MSQAIQNKTDAAPSSLLQEIEHKTPAAHKEKCRASSPFHFVGCTMVTVLLGKKAQDVPQLKEALEDLPGESLFFHMTRPWFAQEFVASPFPNDFALWSAREAGDVSLAEKLSILDPHAHRDVESLREAVLQVLNDHLTTEPASSRPILGQPFAFLSVKAIHFPGPRPAENLEEFRNQLLHLSAGTIYHHACASVLRGAGRGGDFADWIEGAVGAPKLAAKIRGVSPFLGSLEQYRLALLSLCDEFLKSKQG